MWPSNASWTGRIIATFSFHPTVGTGNTAHAFRANLGAPTEEELQEVRELIGRFEDDDHDIRFSPDGKLLATGCRGGDLKIWTVPEFKLVRTLHAPSAAE